MTEASSTSGIVRKKMMPEDTEFFGHWMTQNHRALTELARHFCRFPGAVEVSFTLKMRKIADGNFTIASGDVTASLEEIKKAFAEHEVQKMKATLAPE
jgi:hypothetical protein